MSSQSDGVSTAAAIGIGVGSAIAAILLSGSIGLFFFLRWRRKRRGPPVPPKEPVFHRGVAAPYELSEELSPRLPPPTKPKRGDPRGGVRTNFRPAELEAVVPSEAPSEAPSEFYSEAASDKSFQERAASLASASSRWTSRKEGSGAMPMPWL
jgi:hypothetical protein